MAAAIAASRFTGTVNFVGMPAASIIASAHIFALSALPYIFITLAYIFFVFWSNATAALTLSPFFAFSEPPFTIGNAWANPSSGSTNPSLLCMRGFFIYTPVITRVPFSIILYTAPAKPLASMVMSFSKTKSPGIAPLSSAPCMNTSATLSSSGFAKQNPPECLTIVAFKYPAFFGRAIFFVFPSFRVTISPVLSRYETALLNSSVSILDISHNSFLSTGSLCPFRISIISLLSSLFISFSF